MEGANQQPSHSGTVSTDKHAPCAMFFTHPALNLNSPLPPAPLGFPFHCT